MKNLKFLLVLVLPIGLMLGCSKVDPVQDIQDDGLVLKGIGNNAPSGPHYNLNIIGVPKEKTASMDNNNGGRIFVDLGKSGDAKNTKIMLAPGDDFQVLDANGTDGVAIFQLPDDVSTTYTVWARALGKPGGKVTITTCAEIVDADQIYDEICSEEPITLTRTGKEAPKFTDVSDNLLFIIISTAVTNDAGTVTINPGKYPLFDPRLENYFWSYDNEGLKLLQLRFYPIVVES